MKLESFVIRCICKKENAQSLIFNAEYESQISQATREQMKKKETKKYMSRGPRLHLPRLIRKHKKTKEQRVSYILTEREGNHIDSILISDKKLRQKSFGINFPEILKRI